MTHTDHTYRERRILPLTITTSTLLPISTPLSSSRDSQSRLCSSSSTTWRWGVLEWWHYCLQSEVLCSFKPVIVLNCFFVFCNTHIYFKSCLRFNSYSSPSYHSFSRFPLLPPFSPLLPPPPSFSLLRLLPFLLPPPFSLLPSPSSLLPSSSLLPPPSSLPLRVQKPNTWQQRHLRSCHGGSTPSTWCGSRDWKSQRPSQTTTKW